MPSRACRWQAQDELAVGLAANLAAESAADGLQHPAQPFAVRGPRGDCGRRRDMRAGCARAWLGVARLVARSHLDQREPQQRRDTGWRIVQGPDLAAVGEGHDC